MIQTNLDDIEAVLHRANDDVDRVSAYEYREALRDAYYVATIAESDREDLEYRLSYVEANSEQSIRNEALKERYRIVAWMRNRVVHKTTASMQTLDELVSICDAIHRGEHE